MNFASIYSTATTPDSVLEEQQAKQAQQALASDFEPSLAVQRHDAWMKDPETERFFKGLMHVFNGLVDNALVNAKSTLNPQQAISQNNTLVVADTIKKVIDYGRTNKW